MPYRDTYSAGFAGPRLTPWVKRLLAVTTTVFVGTIFVHMFGPDVTPWLALFPREVLRHPWTVLTYPLTHGLSVISWLFSSLMVFFLGPRLEERWGGAGLLRYSLVAVLTGAAGALALAGFAGVDFPLVGMNMLTLGWFFAWALFWPTEEILFFGIIPIQIRWLFAGILVVSLLGYASLGVSGLLFLVPLAATLGGCYALMQSHWAPPSWGELPAPRTPRRRAQPKAVQWAGKKEAPAASPPPRPIAGPPRSARAERELLDDVDRILDKISAEGLAALSEEERKRLDEVSRRYRTN